MRTHERMNVHMNGHASERVLNEWSEGRWGGRGGRWEGGGEGKKGEGRKKIWEVWKGEEREEKGKGEKV